MDTFSPFLLGSRSSYFRPREGRHLQRLAEPAHQVGFLDDLVERSPLPVQTSHLPLDQDVREQKLSYLLTKEFSPKTKSCTSLCEPNRQLLGNKVSMD